MPSRTHPLLGVLCLLALLVTFLVGIMGRPVMRIGEPVLPLEADGLVGHEVAKARVNGGRDGKRNDNAYGIHKYQAA